MAEAPKTQRTDSDTEWRLRAAASHIPNIPDLSTLGNAALPAAGEHSSSHPLAPAIAELAEAVTDQHAQSLAQREDIAEDTRRHTERLSQEARADAQRLADEARQAIEDARAEKFTPTGHHEEVRNRLREARVDKDAEKILSEQARQDHEDEQDKQAEEARNKYRPKHELDLDYDRLGSPNIIDDIEIMVPTLENIRFLRKNGVEEIVGKRFLINEVEIVPDHSAPLRRKHKWLPGRKMYPSRMVAKQNPRYIWRYDTRDQFGMPKPNPRGKWIDRDGISELLEGLRGLPETERAWWVGHDKVKEPAIARYWSSHEVHVHHHDHGFGQLITSDEAKQAKEQLTTVVKHPEFANDALPNKYAHALYLGFLATPNSSKAASDDIHDPDRYNPYRRYEVIDTRTWHETKYVAGVTNEFLVAVHNSPEEDPAESIREIIPYIMGERVGRTQLTRFFDGAVSEGHSYKSPARDFHWKIPIPRPRPGTSKVSVTKLGP